MFVNVFNRVLQFNSVSFSPYFASNNIEEVKYDVADALGFLFVPALFPGLYGIHVCVMSSRNGLFNVLSQGIASRSAFVSRNKCVAQ